jgi:hypothetical protein
MSQLSLSQARIIDPVLTSVAQGYKQPDFIGGALFPQVPVGLRAGKIVTFGKEDFMLYTTRRAPGENTKRIQFGLTSGSYSLEDHSLEGAVPIENYQEGMAPEKGFTIDHYAIAIRKVSAIMALRLEKAQADLATTAGNYGSSNKATLSGTSQWSDYSGTSNPIADVETAKEAIRAATGKRPNVINMGAKVFAKLKQHPVVRDYLKYTGRDVATAEIMASLFGVAQVNVGDAIYSNDAGTAFTDVWGKSVVLAFTEVASLADQGTPTYGYTYNLNGYPIVEQPYFDRNAKSWFVPVTRAEAPVIAGSGAGYLLSNAVA